MCGLAKGEPAKPEESGNEKSAAAVSCLPGGDQDADRRQWAGKPRKHVQHSKCATLSKPSGFRIAEMTEGEGEDVREGPFGL